MVGSVHTCTRTPSDKNELTHEQTLTSSSCVRGSVHKALMAGSVHTCTRTPSDKNTFTHEQTLTSSSCARGSVHSALMVGSVHTYACPGRTHVPALRVGMQAVLMASMRSCLAGRAKISSASPSRGKQRSHQSVLCRQPIKNKPCYHIWILRQRQRNCVHLTLHFSI